MNSCNASFVLLMFSKCYFPHLCLLAHSYLERFFTFLAWLLPIISYFIRANKFANCQWIYDLVIVSQWCRMASFPNKAQKLSPKILHNMGSTNCFDEKNIQTNCLRDLGHNSGKKGLVNVISLNYSNRLMVTFSVERICIFYDICNLKGFFTFSFKWVFTI